MGDIICIPCKNLIGKEDELRMSGINRSSNNNSLKKK